MAKNALNIHLITFPQKKGASKKLLSTKNKINKTFCPTFNIQKMGLFDEHKMKVFFDEN